MKSRICVTMFLLASAGIAYAAPATTVKTAKGEVLAGEKDMTLYTFKKDTKDTSNCYDACAQKWPPFMAAAGAKAQGDFTVIKRKDGSMQWAKGGMPLYYWMNDKKKGDATGDGVGGVWDVAKP